MGNSNTKKSATKSKNGQQYGQVSFNSPTESKDLLSPSESKEIMHQSTSKPYNQLSMESIISSNNECSMAFLKPSCKNKQIIIKNTAKQEQNIQLGVKLPSFSYLKKSSTLSCIYITFDITYVKYPHSDYGRHGGVYFGSKNYNDTRFNGKYTIEKGAKVTTIDWIDRKSDKGFRIYGTNESKLSLSNHLGIDQFVKNNYQGNWKIVINEKKQGNFYFNNECIYENFNVIYNDGCFLGFWCWLGNEMKVENLQFGYGVNYDIIRKIIEYWYFVSQNGLHMKVKEPWHHEVTMVICDYSS